MEGNPCLCITVQILIKKKQNANSFDILKIFYIATIFTFQFYIDFHFTLNVDVF